MLTNCVVITGYNGSAAIPADADCPGRQQSLPSLASRRNHHQQCGSRNMVSTYLSSHIEAVGLNISVLLYLLTVH